MFLKNIHYLAAVNLSVSSKTSFSRVYPDPFIKSFNKQIIKPVRMELTLYRLEFDVNSITRRFTVLNNAEQFGFTMERIFNDWINDCTDITADSFCEFIRSRNNRIVCFTEAEYNELLAE